MQEMIAYCGIVCSDCPAFIATRDDDDKAKENLAASWATQEYPLKPEDINCDGCITHGGELVSFCYDCDIRKCGVEKNMPNCAYCADFPCEKLHRQWENPISAPAKAKLEEIRKSLGL